MRNGFELKSVYERIDAARMSETERRAAMNALRDAEMIADAILWVTRKIEQLGARLFLKASPKH